MKHTKVPNTTLARLGLATLLICYTATASDEHASAGRVQAGAGNNKAADSPKADRLIRELQLTPDYRSVRLNWSLSRRSGAGPSAFSVRYCELTSWNIEIKCRRKELRVVPSGSGDAIVARSSPAPPATTGATTNSVMIPGQAQEFVRQLEPFSYEAQIYDLRALTNYTFQIQEGGLAGSSGAGNASVSASAGASVTSGAGSAVPPPGRARLLAERPTEGLTQANWIPNEPVQRVETKPFSAEATRCLANSSEILIATGKYFGGRISVENSLDPRCILLGNKSSEQTDYLFRIDHDICHSKLTNGNRVESMVLVHENKEILTHNTARFLVLCTFQHRNSFTLRAAVSLPRIQGPGSPAAHLSRPAVIWPVSGPEAHAVTLGSMPGFYRARAGGPPAEPVTPEAAELETNMISLQQAPAGKPGAHRSPKELASVEPVSPPSPVQVQSRTLYVDRAGPESNRNGRARPTDDGQPALLTARGSRLLTRPSDGGARQLAAGADAEASASEPAASSHLSSGGPTPDSRASTTAGVGRQSSVRAGGGQAGHDGAGSVGALALNSGPPGDLQAVPIIMTNNHRTLYRDSRPLEKSPAEADFSIKYSAAPVNEYSLRQAPTLAGGFGFGGLGGGGGAAGDYLNAISSRLEQFAQVSGARTARMRSVEQEAYLGAVADESEAQPSKAADLRALNRIGELVSAGTSSLSPAQAMPEPEQPAGADLRADASEALLAPVQLAAGGDKDGSLAHNITSYLLKWSLRTLTNLARKSLDTLVQSNETERAAPVSDEDPLGSLGAPTGSTEAGISALPPSDSASSTRPTQSGPPQLDEPAARTGGGEPPPSSPVAQRSRPANYSRSLDLSRRPELQPAPAAWPPSASSSSSASTSTTPPARHSNRRQAHGSSDWLPALKQPLVETTPASGVPADSAADAGEPSRQLSGRKRGGAPTRWNRLESSPVYSGWPLYALLLVAALSAALFLTFCLAGGAGGLSRGRTPAARTGLGGPGDFQWPAAGSLEPRRATGLGAAPEAGAASPSQRSLDSYSNKFDTDTINKRALLTAHADDRASQLDGHCEHTRRRLDRPAGSGSASPSAAASSAASSRDAGAGRPASGCSTLLASDENDCRSSELLYTEHVLINAGPSFGESYA